MQCVLCSGLLYIESNCWQSVLFLVLICFDIGLAIVACLTGPGQVSAFSQNCVTLLNYNTSYVRQSFSRLVLRFFAVRVCFSAGMSVYKIDMLTLHLDYYDLRFKLRLRCS